jgi:hypothetical protein
MPDVDDPDYGVWEKGRERGKGKAMRYTDYRKATAASCIAEMQAA